LSTVFETVSMSRKKNQRLDMANGCLQLIREDLAFIQVSISVTDHGRHWRFFFQRQWLVSYWPATAKLRTVYSDETVTDVTPQRVRDIVVATYERFIKEIRRGLQG